MFRFILIPWAFILEIVSHITFPTRSFIHEIVCRTFSIGSSYCVSYIAFWADREFLYFWQLEYVLLSDSYFCYCRQVVTILHSQIADAFAKLEISTPQAKRRYPFNFQLLSWSSLFTPFKSRSELAIPFSFGLNYLLTYIMMSQSSLWSRASTWMHQDIAFW